MADNDIIKGLKACGYNETCADCPYIDIDRGDCTEEMAKDAFNLINRQKAEIERYKGVIKILENDVQASRTEVVREFVEKAEKIVELVNRADGGYDIDELVKEMVGEDDTSHPDERKEKSNEHNKPN